MSKLKELKENVKEKGKRALNWVEENPGKTDAVIYSAFLGTLIGISLKYCKNSEKRQNEEYEKVRTDYHKFLEQCLQKTFEEKGIRPC